MSTPDEDRAAEDRAGEDRPAEDRAGEDRPDENRAEEDRPGEVAHPDGSHGDLGAEWAGLRTAIVVGGGIAGLVAARELAIGGLRVTLLEASDRLGGKVARHTVAGVELDAGAESFATKRGTVAEFATRLGAQVAQPNPAGAWLQRDGGEPLPLPKTALLGIPGTPFAADVIAAVGLGGAFRAQLDSFLGLLGAKERTLGGLVRKRMGRRVLDRLVTPIVLGVHSRHPDELEVDVVAPGLRQALRSTASLAQAVLRLRAAAPAGSAVGGVDGGIYELVALLEQRLAALGVDVRLGARVESVSASGVTLDGGGVLEADHVVLATVLGGLSDASIVLATLVVDSKLLDAAPRGTGMLVAPGTPGVRAKALTHATAKWQWLARELGSGRHVLRLSYDATALDGVDSLREQARTDAATLLGVPIPAESVLGFDRVDWTAPARPEAVPEGVVVIGESVAGTGLASVIAHARAQSGSLLNDRQG
jgi:oxygen-dependent protoporphyrinogen oxidase